MCWISWHLVLPLAGLPTGLGNGWQSAHSGTGSAGAASSAPRVSYLPAGELWHVFMAAAEAQECANTQAH